MFQLLQAKFVYVALIVCGLVLSSHAYAQSNQNSDHYIVTSVDCEDEEQTKLLLDHAILTAGKDKSIIIIARLGIGESSRKIIRRRLSAVSRYLVETRGISKSRVIPAEGERVRDLGYVEVYVGGNLFILFKMKRSRDFGSGCRP
jgi:hypothetical protein